MMTASSSNTSIKKQARDVLSRLYNLQYEETGYYLSPDEFFPIDLNKVISYIMNWELESVSDIGTDSNGQRLRGHCNYDKKLIQIAFEGISPGEKIFTAAHEIGHAVLHTDAHRTSPGSARKRTIRKVDKLITPAQERKMEREANMFASEILMPEKAVRDYFLRVFGREKIWVGSSKAQNIIKDFSQKIQKITSNLKNAKDFSPYFADYKKTRSNPSMREFFGVSRIAMSIRLLELKLIF